MVAVEVAASTAAAVASIEVAEVVGEVDLAVEDLGAAEASTEEDMTKDPQKV